MTATPETTTETHHHFLTGLAQQGWYAHEFARAGQTAEALEHTEAIEGLIAAYRIAIGAPAEGLSGELVVQTPRTSGSEWRDWSKPISGLFMEHARGQLEQARRARPDLVFRLARRVVFEHVSDVDGGE